MHIAVVIDIVSSHDVGVVELGDCAGLETESLEVRRVVHAVSRQDFHGHTPPHELVLGEVDAAHAALADLAQELVLAQSEALVLAGEQLVGLPARDKPLFDEKIGESLLVLERCLAVLRCGFLEERRELGLVNEVTTLKQVDQLIGGHLGHRTVTSLMERCTPAVSLPPQRGQGPRRARSAHKEEWSPRNCLFRLDPSLSIAYPTHECGQRKNCVRKCLAGGTRSLERLPYTISCWFPSDQQFCPENHESRLRPLYALPPR